MSIKRNITFTPGSRKKDRALITENVPIRMREQMIRKLRNELLKEKNLIEVFNIIRSKPQMNRDLLKNITNENDALEELIKLIKDPNSVIYTSILVTIK